MWATADICDEFGEEVEVAAPLLHDFGGLQPFHGPFATVSVSDDNTSVRQMLEQPGAGRVLVVDGGASTRCALVGDRLAQLSVENGWAGIVVNGCVCCGFIGDNGHFGYEVEVEVFGARRHTDLSRPANDERRHERYTVLIVRRCGAIVACRRAVGLPVQLGICRGAKVYARNEPPRGSTRHSVVGWPPDSVQKSRLMARTLVISSGGVALHPADVQPRPG